METDVFKSVFVSHVSICTYEIFVIELHSYNAPKQKATDINMNTDILDAKVLK